MIRKALKTGVLLAAVLLASCASGTGGPASRSAGPQVPIQVWVHPAYTQILNVAVYCEERGSRVRRRQIRSGAVLKVPACRSAVVGVWSRGGTSWRQSLPLYPGQAYRLDIQRPIIHTSILHTN